MWWCCVGVVRWRPTTDSQPGGGGGGEGGIGGGAGVVASVHRVSTLDHQDGGERIQLGDAHVDAGVQRPAILVPGK